MYTVHCTYTMCSSSIHSKQHCGSLTMPAFFWNVYLYRITKLTLSLPRTIVRDARIRTWNPIRQQSCTLHILMSHHWLLLYIFSYMLSFRFQASNCECYAMVLIYSMMSFVLLVSLPLCCLSVCLSSPPPPHPTMSDYTCLPVLTYTLWIFTPIVKDNIGVLYCTLGPGRGLFWSNSIFS